MNHGMFTAPESGLPENPSRNGRDAADLLNRGCFCRTVDHAALRRGLESGSGTSYAEIMATRPNLFSDTRVFVLQPHLDFMAELIRAV